VEGVVALVRGEAEGGLSLVGFGVDSLVEVASGLLVLRHLLAEPDNAAAAANAVQASAAAPAGRSAASGLRCLAALAAAVLPVSRNRVGSSGSHGGGGGGGGELFGPLDAFAAERAATLAIGSLLGLLAAVAAAGAGANLVTGTGPHAAVSALVVSSASLSFMGALWAAKVRGGWGQVGGILLRAVQIVGRVEWAG
jgi:hypothetical protein